VHCNFLLHFIAVRLKGNPDAKNTYNPSGFFKSGFAMLGKDAINRVSI